MRYYYKQLSGNGLLDLKTPLEDLTDYIEITEQEFNEIISSREKAVKDNPLRTINRQIAQLKNQLKQTDYKAIKYAEGLISEEDYAPIKTSREAIREQIRELESKLI